MQAGYPDASQNAQYKFLLNKMIGVVKTETFRPLRISANTIFQRLNTEFPREIVEELYNLFKRLHTKESTEMLLFLVLASPYCRKTLSARLLDECDSLQLQPDVLTANALEFSITRDILNSYIGLNSRNVKYSASRKKFVLTLGSGVNFPRAQTMLMNHILEPGNCYKFIVQELETNSYSESKSPIIQAFVSNMKILLDEYVLFVNRIQTKAESCHENNIGFIELYALSREKTRVMSFLATIMEQCRNLKWYDIISTVKKYSRSVDKTILCIVDKLLNLEPLVSAMKMWLLEGHLEDAQDDFFIKKRNVPSDGNIWDHAFYVDKTSLPTIISEESSETILFIGKVHHLLSSLDPNYRPLPEVESIINNVNLLEDLIKCLNEIQETCNRAVLSISIPEMDIIKISDFLMNVLLLSNRKFGLNLLIELESRIFGVYNTFYKYNFIASLESSLNTSISQNIPRKFLERLNFAVTTEVKMDSKLIDSLVIEYFPEFPENILLTNELMSKYRDMFIFIWKIFRLHTCILRGTKLRAKFSSFIRKRKKEEFKIFYIIYIFLGSAEIFLHTLLTHIEVNCIQPAYLDLKSYISREINFNLRKNKHLEYVDTLKKKVLFFDNDKSGELKSSLYKVLNHIQKLMQNSWKVQKIKISLLREEKNQAISRNILKYENLIIDDAESGSVICKLQQEVFTTTKSDLESTVNLIKLDAVAFKKELEHFENLLSTTNDPDYRKIAECIRFSRT